MSLTDQNDEATAGGDQGVSPSTDAPTVDSDQGVNADAPTAPEGDDTPSYVDAALKALDDSEGDDEDSPASNEQGEDAGEATDKPDEANKDAEEGQDEDKSEEELSEADMAKLPERTRSRINQLLEGRRENAERAEKAEGELEKLKPAAEGYEKITAFLSDNGVSTQDAASALQLAGLIQNDPAKAYEQLKPLMDSLAQKTGAQLPQDLAEDVRTGRITQDRAQELSRSRATASQHEQRAQAERARREEERQAQEQERRQQEQARQVQQFASVGDQLAAEKAQSDPDWKLKEPLVVDRLKAELAEKGMPESEADLRQRFDDAVKSATAYMRQLSPGRKPDVKPTESVSSTRQHTTPPKSPYEAAMRALGE